MALCLIIDSKRCEGHGMCYGMNAEDLIAPDQNGHATPQDKPIPVPAGREEQARDAAAGCPEGAISLVEN